MNDDSYDDDAVAEIRKAILLKTKKRGRRLTADEARDEFGYYGHDADEAIDSLTESGILLPGRHQKNEESPEGPRSQREEERRGRRKRDSAPPLSFRKYKNELTEKHDKKKKGLPGEIISFLTVNAVLWFVNTRYTAGIPWASFVSVLWGLGILESLSSLRLSSRQIKEIEAVGTLGEEQTKELKTINDERLAIRKSVFGTLNFAAIMTCIASFTIPWSPWLAIPVGISAISTVTKLITFVATNPRKRQKFLQQAKDHPAPLDTGISDDFGSSETKNLGRYRDLYADAIDSAADIENALQKSDPALATEIRPDLQKCVNQVLLLAKSANELDSIIADIPMDALRKDKANLIAKRDQAQSPLRLEYEESIAEIEKQEASFKSLQDQKEIINLRLRSSVNQLNQLKLDLAKARILSSETGKAEGETALKAVQQRVEELARNVEDFSQGLREATRDPFDDLEKESNSLK
ncbi:MAG: 2TM domain-containing protein [Spirochaetaceae bacterium]|nr:2TM domain-containing protein [Spirochaetaceae bacterium]